MTDTDKQLLARAALYVFPESCADELWVYRGCVCNIRLNTQPAGEYYCGYARLLDPPEYIDEAACIDIDVHGGVTYSERAGGSIVVGFDCAHASDYVNELLIVDYRSAPTCATPVLRKWHPEDVRAECEKLARGLLGLIRG